MFRIIFAVALLCAPSLAFAETCVASHYGVGDGYGGRRTANGEIMNASILALSVAVTFGGPQRAKAANECGVGPSVTCTAASYPGGIVYSTGAAAQTVTLTGDLVLNATRFQSVTTNGYCTERD